MKENRRKATRTLLTELAKPIPELGPAFADTNIFPLLGSRCKVFLVDRIESEALLIKALRAYSKLEHFEIGHMEYLSTKTLDYLANKLEVTYPEKFAAEIEIAKARLKTSSKRRTTREERKKELKEKLHDRDDFEKVLMCYYALPALKSKVKLEKWTDSYGNEHEYFFVGNGKVYKKVYLFCEDDKIRQEFSNSLKPRPYLYPTVEQQLQDGRWGGSEHKLFLQFLYKTDPKLFQSTLESVEDEFQDQYTKKKQREDLERQRNTRLSHFRGITDNVGAVLKALLTNKIRKMCTFLKSNLKEVSFSGLDDLEILPYDLDKEKMPDPLDSASVVPFLKERCDKILNKFHENFDFDDTDFLDACQYGVETIHYTWNSSREVTIKAKLFALMFDTSLAPVMMYDSNERVRQVAMAVEEYNRSLENINEEVS